MDPYAHSSETFPSASGGDGEDKKQLVVKPGVCPYFDERQCSEKSATLVTWHLPTWGVIKR
ncbi:hypothetical protein Aduo_011274 [Ancylostoma duodenale]